MKPEPQLIVHVVFRFGVGGLENGIVNLVNHLPRERWRHAILSLTDIAREFTERVVHRDVTYRALDKRPGHLLREYPRLLREFRALRPAIVHTRNLAALEAVVPAWAAGVPVRIHGEHGWDIGDPAGRRHRYRLVRELYRPFVSRYIALSRHLADYLEHQVGVPDAILSQIYNGVDTERFFPAHGRAPIPDCPFQAPEHWLVGSVGRLETIKDPLNLVRAFVRARAMHPVAAQRLRLVVAGEGALRAQAESVLTEAGAREFAWFAGERDDIPQFMRGLDCFVLPSLAEGVSNTILEAMATALPVVATHVGGNAELIESGMTGTLVPPANPNALAAAILAYFDDRAAGHRHAKAAHRVVAARFSLAAMVAAYDRVYERTLAAAGVALPAPRAADPPSPETPLQRATLS
ncbi:MAG TPA: TIGR03088 family PEP-CTERM/XrtA system glycosyltransferase [Casimicrobiaceae bacterium]|nr:TIGR03088 family PEP-CTERM/XrtA system glycosyltransferase [Casimicrobiaceae bacterium]